MAESVSLAVLENLVHMQREDFPVGYVVIGALLPSTIEILSADQLRSAVGDLRPQALGDRWLESVASAVLQVPSAVVPSESNYLLNPRHPDFTKIVTELPLPFLFDDRLFTRRA